MNQFPAPAANGMAARAAWDAWLLHGECATAGQALPLTLFPGYGEVCQRVGFTASASHRAEIGVVMFRLMG